MRTFFIDERQIRDERIEILGTDVNHITNVLRLSKGDRIKLVSSFNAYISEIIEVGKDSLVLSVIEKLEENKELNVRTYLFQGLVKGDKMDLIIQKNVELGISRIYPIKMERSVVRIENKDIEKKLARWNRIAMEAGKQSERSIVPEVMAPLSFKEAIDLSDASLKIIAFEGEEDRSLKDLLSGYKDSSIDFLIGPEGGISKAELGYAISKGFISVSLGKRILRTETASVYISSAISYEFES